MEMCGRTQKQNIFFEGLKDPRIRYEIREPAQIKSLKTIIIG